MDTRSIDTHIDPTVYVLVSDPCCAGSRKMIVSATCREPDALIQYVTDIIGKSRGTWEEILEEERSIRWAVNDFTYGKIKTECGRCTKPICCSSMFDINPWEAYLIAKAHPKLLQSLMANLDEQAAAEKPFLENKEEYFYLQRPCALLKDGKCQVYDVRPLICTITHIIKGERICEEMDDKETHKIGLMPYFSTMYIQLSKHSWETSIEHLKEYGAEDIPCGFIPGLATAITRIARGKTPPHIDRDKLLAYLEIDRLQILSAHFALDTATENLKEAFDNILVDTLEHNYGIHSNKT